MPSERDPRVDPMPGDVLRGLNFGRNETRRVSCVINSECSMTDYATVMFYRGPTASSAVSRDNWRKWAKNAEVVRVAGETEVKK